MLRALTAPTKEPIGIDELKLRLRIDGSSMDPMLPRLISSARETVERQTGIALAAANYEWSPVGGRTAPLPLWPGQVTSPEGAYPILFTTQPGIPPGPLVDAICLLVDDKLWNTSANTDKELTENPAYFSLIAPFRRAMP